MPSSEIEVPDEIREKFNEAAEDDVKFGIMLALEFNDTMNLKHLAVLIGRPEPTVIRYIKKLLEDGLIIIDAKKTASDWGKFYRLSEPVDYMLSIKRGQQEDREKWIIDEMERIDEKSDAEIEAFMVKAYLSKNDIEFDVKAGSQILAYSMNLQKMILNQASSAIKELMGIYKEKGIEYLQKNLVPDLSDLEIYSQTISIYNLRQLWALIKMSNQWWKEFSALKDKFKTEMDEKNIPEDKRKDMFLYTFLGSMEFKFKLKDKE